MRKVLIAAAIMFGLYAPLDASAQQKVRVLASFSILADVVREIGGERVEVASLIGPNTDTHGFQPAPAHAKAVASAKLVVLNGLGFEGWADRLVKSANYKGARLIASKGVKALSAETEGHGHDHQHKHSDRFDPHAWQDVANMKIYAANIRDALIAADPAGKDVYAKNADAYLKKLEALDAEVRQLFSGFSKQERRVITSHDAFHYFGDAYGIEFLAVQGAGDETEPSARDIAQLIQQIKKESVKAIFVESISNSRVIEQIARETGAKLGGTLYSDALSAADGPAATYIDMIRHNAKTIAAALR
ncbi:MAG: metal ABC transporter substrate-binding protein [Xanthobacteraceae bacterium]|nr:metal ABC transporter substrate-binding protein [Xanthobacteraceae bacterium]MCW5674412.1 metal ABC transporter substrate-binding protein [Xanthobacteraceae bacterium]MCW5678728.1 metal ABC transporter substrate-binding protein [Xanthobacteraceae bacterium]